MNQDYIIDIEIVDVHKRLTPSKHYVRIKFQPLS
jgi:hypothetical protein